MLMVIHPSCRAIFTAMLMTRLSRIRNELVNMPYGVSDLSRIGCFFELGIDKLVRDRYLFKVSRYVASDRQEV